MGTQPAASTVPPLFSSPLSFLDSVRVRWWMLGLTPTARIRGKRYRESRRDRRSTVESFVIARQSGAY